MVLYHGSRRAFPVGFVLLPQRDGYVHQCDTQAFEKLVESRRPRDKLSRYKSVFLTDQIVNIDGAGGYDDVVYAAEPARSPEASDLAWYGEAFCLFVDGTEADMAQVVTQIDAYWNGTPYFDPSRSNMEYRTDAARITAVVEINLDSEEYERSLLAVTPQQNKRRSSDNSFDM